MTASSPDQRVWTLCTVHVIGSPEGSCSLCNGDRNLIQVVPRTARDEALEECAAWKAKTRENVREFMTEHPDLRIRHLSDMTGVLEAELDLLSTKLARAMEALEWYANHENNGKRKAEHNHDHDWDYFAWRPIDDDEGEEAREALEAIKEGPLEFDKLQKRLAAAEVCISANRLNARLYGDGGAIAAYDELVKKKEG
jgi:hypothetical protein